MDARTLRHFAFGPFLLMPERQTLLRDGVPVRLGSRALDILQALVEHSGELVSKRELIARAWPHTLVDDSNLKVNMSSLRRALGEAPEDGQYIATVSGRGYKFIGSVEVRQPLGEVPAPETPALRSHNLPTGTPRIFGRTGEIDNVTADIQTSPLVSLVGAGGVGKTTVAIAVADRFVGVMKDGVWLVDFAALKDPAMAPSAIAASLGLFTNSSAVLDVICNYLRDREMLLLFDNCEHVIDAAAECADRILTAARDVRILATSREAIGVKCERVRRLSGLGFPASSSGLKAAEALTFPAIQLFVERATQRLESFELRDEDAPVVADICRRLDGVALAIELAGTRIDAFTASGILSQLDDRFRALVGRRAGPKRQRTLAATLDWSHDLLSSEDAGLLDAVSVFSGAFGVHDAAAVAGTSVQQASEGLAQIAAKSLLASDFDGESIAYRLLETTRAYCRDRLQAAGQLDTIHRRHALRVCEILDQAWREWKDRAAREWGELYRPILNDLRAALAWAGGKTGDRALLIDLTLKGTILWNHFSLTNECRVAVLRAVSEIAAAGLSGTATEMRLLTFLAGAIMFTRGPTREALDASLRALDIATAHDDVEFQLRSLWMIGSCKVFAGDYNAAIDRMETFLTIAEAKDPSAAPGGEALLAAAEFYVGRLDSAQRRVEAHFRPDLAVLEGSRLARFQFVSNSTFGVILSMIHWVKGRPDQAGKTIELVVQKTLQTGHKMEILSALVMSGCPIALLRNQHDDARRYLSILDQILDQSGLDVWRPVALYYRGVLFCSENRSSVEGVAMLQSAMADLDAIGQKLRRAYFLGALARALAQVGRLTEATSAIHAAIDHALTHNEGWCFPELLRIQANLLATQDLPREAEALFIRSMALAREIGALSWELRAANDLAALWQSESRDQEARAMLLPVYEQFTEGHDTGDLLLSKRLLALA